VWLQRKKRFGTRQFLHGYISVNIYMDEDGKSMACALIVVRVGFLLTSCQPSSTDDPNPFAALYMRR
jgi:hypothetical protein